MKRTTSFISPRRWPSVRHGVAAGALLLAALGVAGAQGQTAPEVQSKPILFYHESPEAHQLRSLLETYDYGEYASAGKTEFEKMQLLRDWVYRHIAYDSNFADQDLLDAPAILERAKDGGAFLCTNFATVYLQCALSLGWTARYFILRMPTGEAHATCDIWSNEYRKWVFMDPSWNVHLEKKGVPLSIEEVRREWLRNTGKNVTFVFGAGSSRERYGESTYPVVRSDSRIWQLHPLDSKWLSYTYEIALAGRNNFFTMKGNGDIWTNMYIIKDSRNWLDKYWPFRKKKAVKGNRAMFHDLNRLDLKVLVPEGPARRPGAVALVRFDAFGPNNYTPYFQDILVQVDGGDWVSVSDQYAWRLKSGKNVLRARIRNLFGVEGPVSVKRIMVPASTAARH